MTKKVVDGCIQCRFFQNNPKYYCICGKKGIEKMLEEKTWVSFNADHNASLLDTNFPSWCPEQNKMPLLTYVKQGGALQVRSHGTELFKTIIRGMYKSFVSITPGDLFTWIHPKCIEKECRAQVYTNIQQNGTGPFMVGKIMSHPGGVTTLEFLDDYGYTKKFNIYLFVKYSK